MKEIADYWFHSPGGECGIMVVEVEITGERKAYVGVGTGLNYAADRKRILMWGTKLPQSRLEEILRLLQGKATKIEVMKGLLESQVIKDDLGALDPRIVEVEDGLVLEVRSQEVGFSFDETGEKFRGMYNFKE